ncbi:protease modulator HflC [Thalassoroseus pseudoceratinae]|uniref:protease modulator HflC n=1 Tax=Thalassoroseus pseudoceratinae TaxID=2713176 RepID=UPI0014246416|nr:protease modulator HflC [Thalassoroseus pseudoceratinae]
MSDSASISPRLRPLAIVLTILGIGVWLTTAVLFVQETEAVLIERFGRLVAVYDQPSDRGLQWKWPWPIELAHRFDGRIQLLDPAGRELLTRDRKNIVLDAWVSWRIADPIADAPEDLTNRPSVRFYRAFGQHDFATSRLATRIRSILANRIGQTELSEILNSSDQQAQEAALTQLNQSVLEELRKQPHEDDSVTDRFGVEILDFGIKRLNFPEGNRRAVFARMQSERQKIASRYRSAGEAEAQKIRSRADLQAAAILGKAEADADRIRGAGEAAALALLNAAHVQDEEFYRVLRTLDSYRKILSPKSTLVLSTSSELFRLLTDGLPTNRVQPNANSQEPLEP